MCAAQAAQDAPPDEPAKAPPSDAAMVERALNELSGGDWILQWEAVHDLAERRAEQAVPKLDALLGEKNENWLRAEALLALAGIRREAVLPKALEFSKERNPTLRASALKAMGVIGADSALPAIEDALKDSNSGVRGEALVALAKISNGAAWPAVKQALAGDEPLTAIRALPYIDQVDAKLRLLALLESKDRSMRIAVLSALKEARQVSMVKPLMLRLSKEPERVLQEAIVAALSAVDPHFRNPILLELLDTGETKSIETVLDLLAATPGVAVSDRIEKLLPRIEQDVPSALPRIFRFMASRDADRYAAVFAQQLQNAKPESRLAAIEALARCKKSDRFKLLRPLLTDSEPRVSEAVFTAIRVASHWAPEEGFVDYLQNALQSSDKAIFRNAAALLRDRLSAQEFMKAFALLKPRIAGSSDEWRDAAIGALVQAADPEGARQIAAAQGYVTHWQVIGPFRENAGEGPIEALMTADKGFDPTKRIKIGEDVEIGWGTYDVDRTDGGLELQSVLGDERMSSGYAIASFKIGAAQTARAQIALDGDVTIYLNGKKLTAGKEKKQTVDVELLGGPNRIFVKIVRTDNTRPTLRIRFVDKAGAAIECTSLQK